MDMRSVDKNTKICALKVVLLNQVSIEGMLHVAIHTSSSIRPSDAIREIKTGYIVLTDATIIDQGVSTRHPSVMVPISAISYLQLPESGWMNRKQA